MSFMIAFGLASIMLLMGVFLRSKVPFLRNMLVPSSVIAGILGIVFMNVAATAGMDVGADFDMFTTIVNNLFTVSFISISLTSTPKNEGNNARNILKGAVGLGLIWCFLYAVTPIVSMGVVSLAGSSFDMDGLYGMLIPFAYCQGPGQSAAYGSLFEQFGLENAAMVAITFSAVGFVSAFLVGVPAAKLGVSRGIAKNCGTIDAAILKGYYKKSEQNDYMVKDTTCSGNVETLTFHFALIGLCYVLALLIGKILGLLPGFLGTSMEGMTFMNGMYAAYIVKWAMKKLHVEFLQENTLQGKITGWTADYLVVCAFMAVSVNIIRKWILPMLLVCVIITIVTFVACFYFGQRMGGSNDFERTLGLYGTCTGTVPSGIALIRIVDPDFRTTTSVELGACNLVMTASTPVYIIILALASGSLGLLPAIGGLALCAAGYLAALKLTKTWGRKTFCWKGNT